MKATKSQSTTRIMISLTTSQILRLRKIQIISVEDVVATEVGIVVEATLTDTNKMKDSKNSTQTGEVEEAIVAEVEAEKDIIVVDVEVIIITITTGVTLIVKRTSTQEIESRSIRTHFRIQTLLFIVIEKTKRWWIQPTQTTQTTLSLIKK